MKIEAVLPAKTEPSVVFPSEIESTVSVVSTDANKTKISALVEI